MPTRFKACSATTWIAAAFALASCGDTGSNVPAGLTPGPTSSVTGVLKSIADDPHACENLRSAFASTAEAQLRTQFEYLRNFPPGQNYGAVAVSGAASTAQSPAAAPATASADSGSNFSQTNVQTARVDELDYVKNDAKFLYTFSQRFANGANNLIVSKINLVPSNQLQRISSIAWPAQVDSPVAAASTANANFSPYPSSDFQSAAGLFRLKTGKLAAVVSGGGYYGPVCGMPAALSTADSIGPSWGYSTVAPYSEIRVLSNDPASTTAQMSQERAIRLSGRLVSSRYLASADRILAITEAPVIWPQSIEWYPKNATTGMSTANWQGLLDKTLASNVAVLKAYALESWLGEAQVLSPKQCATYKIVDAPSRMAVTKVHTIDPAVGVVASAAILAEGLGVYVSNDAIYLSTTRWLPNSPASANGVFTDVHRFSYDAQGVATYEASGKVKGWLINRFAMDEVIQNGKAVLRVAASDRDYAVDAQRGQPYSFLAMLQQNGKQLDQIGETAKIAPGETLQSARFSGDRAYVVTFLQVDPFFVYDLADPSKPKELGELNIPGFSSYLQVLSKHLVLGIGVDGGTWPRNVKASLFDVSDPSKPVESGNLVVGSSYGYSEALWNPHAMTFYSPDPANADLNLAGGRLMYTLPVGNEMLLIEVRGDKTMSLKGKQNLAPSGAGSGCCAASRAAFIDSTLYGIGQEQVVASSVSTPATEIARVGLWP